MNGAAAELLTKLVRIPSPSGEEANVACFLAEYFAGQRIDVTRDDAAVRAVVESGKPGPTLVLASHLDTVPPGQGWSVDPYAGVLADGHLTARGAVDAKASVAAMTRAAVDCAEQGRLETGRLVVLATYGEETRATSMPEARARLPWPIDAAVVGEPTRLAPCVAQRGLLILRLHAAGEQRHAGWVDADTPNAIYAMAEDLERLRRLDLGAVHPTPTVATGGVSHNVSPAECQVTLDLRTTSATPSADLVARIRETVRCTVEVLSDRFPPVETPDGSRLLCAVERVSDAPGIASPTASDWVFLRDVDGIKLGPGDSRQSHTPDETIDLAEVDRAAGLYASIAAEYLS